MTDAGRVTPLATSAAGTARARLLMRIAGALDVPVSDFHERSPARDARRPGQDECDALLEAFRRIHDPDTRRRCLALIRSFGER